MLTVILVVAFVAAGRTAARIITLKQRLAAQGFDAVGNTPEQFTEVIRRDLARWKGVIEAAKIRAEPQARLGSDLAFCLV